MIDARLLAGLLELLKIEDKHRRQLEAAHAEIMRAEMTRVLAGARWEQYAASTVNMIETVLVAAWPAGRTWIRERVQESWEKTKKERSLC
jgi:hypothetical protein